MRTNSSIFTLHARIDYHGKFCFQPSEKVRGQFHSDSQTFLSSLPLNPCSLGVTTSKKYSTLVIFTYYFCLDPQKIIKQNKFSLFFPAFTLYIPLLPRLDPAAEPTTADPSTYFAGFALGNEGDPISTVFLREWTTQPRDCNGSSCQNTAIDLRDALVGWLVGGIKLTKKHIPPSPWYDRSRVGRLALQEPAPEW